jgi:hypothetical protein
MLTAVLLVLGSRAHGAAAAGWILACGAGVLYIAQSGFWAAARTSPANTSASSPGL